MQKEPLYSNIVYNNRPSVYSPVVQMALLSQSYGWESRPAKTAERDAVRYPQIRTVAQADPGRSVAIENQQNIRNLQLQEQQQQQEQRRHQQHGHQYLHQEQQLLQLQLLQLQQQEPQQRSQQPFFDWMRSRDVRLIRTGRNGERWPADLPPSYSTAQRLQRPSVHRTKKKKKALHEQGLPKYEDLGFV